MEQEVGDGIQSRKGGSGLYAISTPACSSTDMALMLSTHIEHRILDLPF